MSSRSLSPALESNRRKAVGSIFWAASGVLFLLSILSVPLEPSLAFVATRIIAPGFLLLVIAFFASTMNRDVAPELLLFLLFIGWSTTGAIVAISSAWFIRYLLLIIQLLAMIFVIHSVIQFSRSARWAFWAMAAYAFLAYGLTILKGEVLQNYGYGSYNQLAGILGNANVFGFAMMMGILSILYFGKRATSVNRRLFLLALAAFFFLGLIQSGSRKAFLSTLILIAIWAILCLKNRRLRKRRNLLGLIVVFGLLYFVYDYTLERAYLGQRLKSIYKTDNIAHEKRYKLYLEGLNMVIGNPVAGVGLGNFVTNSRLRLFSHSDLLEVASTTGIPGLLLYSGIYALLMARLRRLSRRVRDEIALYDINLMKAILTAMLLIGLGRAHFLETDSMVIIGVLIGYSRLIEKSTIASPSAGAPAPPGAVR